MNILGIHDGHTATACLMNGGEIQYVVSEERLTGRKGQGGFPAKAISLVLNKSGVESQGVDAVAVVGTLAPLTSTHDYDRGRQRFFPFLSRISPISPRALIRAYLNVSNLIGNRRNAISRQLADFGLRYKTLTLVDHHHCHATTAYYLSPFYLKNEPVLVVTLDGSGDGSSGTVCAVDELGEWSKLRTFSSFDSLGMIYSRITQLLGMRPWEHEYKLMGMAPYADREAAERVLRILRGYFDISADGLSPWNKTRLWGNSLLASLYGALQGCRFDAVCAAVQMLQEQIVTSLIRNWVVKSGIAKVAVAGGCFMNIKANKLVSELRECESLFVMPSCGDESCAIGAALAVNAESRSAGKSSIIAPVKNLYWGHSFSESEIEQTLMEFGGDVSFVRSNDIEKESAELLSKHFIIGRMSGRMEWGARALGNRSILANPSRLENIRKLNFAIKQRDFWMPFAPSILWELRGDYARGGESVESPFMTMAFDSTDLAKIHLVAALHPYDQTMRPQFVTSEQNPGYYRLIRRFREITGIGGILNTSFNLHGMPIVAGPREAICTLLESELDCITLENYIVWRTARNHPLL